MDLSSLFLEWRFRMCCSALQWNTKFTRNTSNSSYWEYYFKFKTSFNYSKRGICLCR